MQLTGPVFLFLLLPCSLVLCLLVPADRRRLVLSLLSLAWYSLVNAGNPVGLLHIAILLASALLNVYLPAPRSAAGGKLRTTLSVLFPILSLCAARLLAEYDSTCYTYPIGLAFITLSMISLAVDIARGDTVRPKNPMDVIGYVLFVPTLVAGPIIRSKHFFDSTDSPRFTSAQFSLGVRLYMLGFIKRIAMAAVLMRALRQLLAYMDLMISLPLVLLLLTVSYLAFYFFFTGTADMARGICAMHGIHVPRDRTHALSSSSPDRIVSGMALSLYRFMLDYVYRPLRGILPRKYGHLTARILVFLLSALFLRTRPEMLLFALPMLLLLLLSQARKGTRKALGSRLLLAPIGLLAGSFFTLALMMDEPIEMFSLFKAALTGGNPFHFYQVFEVVRDFRYLLVVVSVFLASLPVTYLWGSIRRRATARFCITVQSVAFALLFVAFSATLLYLMPQFPGYADQAYGFYQYAR